MKEFVSDRRVTVAASISMLLLGWSIFVNPGGSWPGMLSIAALATLLVISTSRPAPRPHAGTRDVPGPGHPGRREGTRAQAVRGLERQGNSMKVRPLHDRLVVRRVEEKETAKGGIIIPDTAKEKPQEGEVLAAGNGKVLENGTKVALDVKVGDKILFGKYSGTDIRIDGEDVLILREDEVLAVLA